MCAFEGFEFFDPWERKADPVVPSSKGQPPIGNAHPGVSKGDVAKPQPRYLLKNFPVGKTKSVPAGEPAKKAAPVEDVRTEGKPMRSWNFRLVCSTPEEAAQIVEAALRSKFAATEDLEGYVSNAVSAKETVYLTVVTAASSSEAEALKSVEAVLSEAGVEVDMSGPPEEPAA